MSEVTRLPKRSEVPLELTWDLTKIFATDAEFEEAFGQVIMDNHNSTPNNRLSPPSALDAFDMLIVAIYAWPQSNNISV